MDLLVLLTVYLFPLLPALVYRIARSKSKASSKFYIQALLSYGVFMLGYFVSSLYDLFLDYWSISCAETEGSGGSCSAAMTFLVRETHTISIFIVAPIAFVLALIVLRKLDQSYLTIKGSGSSTAT
ncbi:hypothetical protein [Pleionea sediminis]|uniref:hypothetical protein n=1 Tax=Pleionea sediminis TaxID=2569479 RepID=UPI001186DFE0|nr:hypothetical protein [Pleionea sediminis]